MCQSKINSHKEVYELCEGGGDCCGRGAHKVRDDTPGGDFAGTVVLTMVAASTTN